MYVSVGGPGEGAKEACMLVRVYACTIVYYTSAGGRLPPLTFEKVTLMEEGCAPPRIPQRSVGRTALSSQGLFGRVRRTGET